MSLSVFLRVCKHAVSNVIRAQTSSPVSYASFVTRPQPFSAIIRTYFGRPFTLKNVLPSLKLSGALLSIVAVPVVKVASCKKLSHRVEDSQRSSIAEEDCLSLDDIGRLVYPHVGWLLVAIVAAFVTALLNIQIPLYLGELIDAMAEIVKNQSQFGRASLAPISPVAFKLFMSYAAQAGLTFLYISFLSVLGERMAADMKRTLFHKLLHLEMSFFDAEKTGELSSRLNVDIQEFKSSFKLTISQGLRTLAQIVGCMWSLSRLSHKMTLITLSVLPVVIGIGTVAGYFLRSLSRRAQAQSSIAASVADEALSNIRTVRSFAMEEQELSMYSREVDKAARSNEILGLGIGLFQGGTNALLNGIVLGVLYGGSGMIANGELTPGDLMSFLVTAQTIQRSLTQLSVVFGTALRGYTAGSRVMQFARMAPCESFKEDGVCIPYHSLFGDISFNDVSFTYPSRPDQQVLNSLNLTIPAGQVIALCGPSGEGKSTIVSLLERFYEPSKGSVTLDGKDLRTLNVDWLRGQTIGLISQEPVLFATSIAENIRYGRPDATDEDVRQAAKMANAHSFISSFPNGYSTVIGERGTLLSGGQRQRIAIARALLKDAPILILDEATSSLDTESERLVRDALAGAMKGRTVLIIAHRLSTIQAANKICVIVGGRVGEEGTHDQLIKKNGLYARLVQAQSRQ